MMKTFILWKDKLNFPWKYQKTKKKKVARIKNLIPLKKKIGSSRIQDGIPFYNMR